MASATESQGAASDGRWLSLSERTSAKPSGSPFDAIDPETVDARKKAWLAEIGAGGNVHEACERSGMPVGTVYYWAQTDLELAAGLEQAKRNRLDQLERKLDAVIEHPEEYDQALQRPSWMNAIMFRTKFLEPGYRDNAQVNVNVGVQVNQGDIDQAAAEYFQRKQQR